MNNRSKYLTPGVCWAILYVVAFIGVVVLGGCAGPVVKERVETRNVPVIVPCISGERPAPVARLKKRYPLPQWQALTPSQKAAIVGAQALRRQNYGDAITAATAGCN